MSSPGMIDPETEFERELTVFEREVNEAIQCFYIWLTVNDFARKSRKTRRLLDRHAAFWNTAVRALQANSLIALGRVFDKDQRSHGIDRLLQLAESNPGVFSKVALEKRKRKQSANADEWIDEFMSNVYVPKGRDFKRIRQCINKRRKLYESSYKKLRDKVFAHRSQVDVAAFAAKTSVRELGQLLGFLKVLQSALWGLFHNGRKPTLRHVPNSERLWITGETRKFLEFLAETE